MSMMSETEKAYRNMLGESNELREPMSRKEKLLHKMLGEDIELEPPQSIEEELLLQIIEQGGGGGGGGESSLPIVTFVVTGMDSDGMPIFECDKTYNEAYQICNRGNSLARMVIPNQTEKYTTFALIQGLGLRYAFYAYHTDTTLEFMDIYYYPDGNISLDQSRYDKVSDDAPTE